MQQESDALALRALQMAGDLSPADQFRIFSAIANENSRELAAIVATVEALRQKREGSVTVVNVINSGNTYSYRRSEESESRSYSGFEGLDGRTVLVCFALIFTLCAFWSISDAIERTIGAWRGNPVEVQR